MSNRLLAILLLSVSLPISAYAQGTAPAAAPPTASETNQNNANGGISDATPTKSAPTDVSNGGPFVTVPATGAWRFSDLQGKSVYGADGANIGSISDVLVSQDGSVNAVLIGVGGFLGIGEKDVAVNMNALELGPGMSQSEIDAKAKSIPGVSGETTAATGTASAPAGSSPSTTAQNNPAMTNNGQPDANGTGVPTAGTQTGAANSGTNNVQVGSDALPDRIVLKVTREQLQDAPAFEGVRPAK